MAVMDGRGNYNSTLCWECAKACGGCDWSREGIPIPGWNAEPVKINVTHDNLVDSFVVRACPEYNGDGRIRAEDLNITGCMALMDGLMNLAGRDYIKGNANTRREVARFFRDIAPSRYHGIMNRLKPKAAEHDAMVEQKAIKKWVKEVYARDLAAMHRHWIHLMVVEAYRDFGS